MRQRKSLKSEVIRLWCLGRSYGDIAEDVGCSREYVRAAISRARHGGKTPGDRKQDELNADPGYRAARAELLRERYAADEAFRERVKANTRAWAARQKLKMMAPRSGGEQGAKTLNATRTS
jgi:DNA-binding transcriptional regulator PaaX